MSYTVLARRYRSATFDEVIGQDRISQTLRKAIETNRVAHAYLFCGARGTGKTSTARILAKCLNCLSHDAPATVPCNKCDSCLAIARGDDIDVIEIDAASNTGVENVRDIISNAHFRPARARFKVYIIDEVHMLSKNAFNALLKTLEEPPSHVKFILATTEPEKVLATILSRCQRYDFRTISTKEIAAHLKHICQSEKSASADDDALLLVAKCANGSMRDALSLLERLLSGGAVGGAGGQSRLTIQTVEELLGLPRAQTMFDLAQAIGQADVARTLAQADAILAAGMSADALLSSLADHLRDLLVISTCGAASGLVEAPAVSLGELEKQAKQFDPVALTQDIAILEELRRHLRQGHGGRALLEATLVRLALADQFTSIGDLLGRVDGASPPASVEKKKIVAEPPPIVRLATPPPAPVINPIAKAGEDIPQKPQPPAANPPLPVHRQTTPPPPPAPVRLTPELTAQVEEDPFVRTIIQELGGRIVKVD